MEYQQYCRITNKKQVNLLLRRMRRLFTSGQWVIKLTNIYDNPRIYNKYSINEVSIGFVEENKSIIYIDYRYNILCIVAHECFHILYPDADEGMVLDMEDEFMQLLSPTQAKNFLKLVTTYMI